MLRSAVIRRIEDRKQQGAKFDAKHAYVADVCVTSSNEQIDEIERRGCFNSLIAGECRKGLPA